MRARDGSRLANQVSNEEILRGSTPLCLAERLAEICSLFRIFGYVFDTMQFLKVSVDPSLALQQVTRSVPKAKLTSNQAMAMDAFYEATKGNVAVAGLTLDEWRPFFNERHTGDNQASKNTAFARARKELVDKGLLKCSDDIYRLGDKAT